MSSEAKKAVFDKLTSGASRRTELEYSFDSAAPHEANSIEMSVKSVRLSMLMHVMDWAEAQFEEPEIEAKLKSRLGTKKNTPEGRSILQNADKLTLS